METLTPENTASPLDRVVARNALIFSGEIPLLPDEWIKLRWFAYGAITIASLVVLVNLFVWKGK